MASTNETGHIKQVANFLELISFCQNYGADYQPAKSNMEVAAMSALHANASVSLQNVIDKATAFNMARNTRYDCFSNFKKFATKLINAVSATDASDKTIENAKTINRKIQGAVAPGKSTASNGGSTGSTPDDKTISSSQQSYDLMTQHFARLISLLETEPAYAPRETELQVANLKTQLNNMLTANAAVAAAYPPVSSARIQRDVLLYADKDSIYSIQADVKKYIKSVYGALSPQYKQISNMGFINKRY